MSLAALQRWGTAVAFVLLCAGFAAAAPDAFASWANLANLLQQVATLAIVAAAATLVMVIGEFDLSIGFIASLSAVLCVALFGEQLGVVPALAAGMVAALAGGAINGVLVAAFAVPSFVATLANGTILGGIAYWASGGASLFQGVPDGFKALARGDVAGIPTLAWWMAAVLLAVAFLLARTEFGRRLHAIGSNREAARLAGLPIVQDRILAFVLSGGLAGLAGLLLAARLGSVQHTMGDPLLLPAYAAVFLGTTASPTGTPTVAGTFLGVAIAGVLANGLTIVGVEPFVQKMLTGAIIIAAVLVRRLGRPS
ncbi:MAG: ABC transporter permease [Alphaproteobacteria bacterium]